ncbi:MAG: hypothetical protein ACRD1I_05755 [Terriglobia bacterium]
MLKLSASPSWWGNSNQRRASQTVEHSSSLRVHAFALIAVMADRAIRPL